MTLLANPTVQYWMTDFWKEHGDPRTGTFPMMSTFKAPLAIFFAYHFFVLYLGPRLMRHRKPFSLRSIIIPYNLILSVFNFYIFIKLIIETRFGARLFEMDFKPRDDYSDEAYSHMTLAYIYMMSKYVDMLDTVFFVLRKKQNQVTGLHVYHHSMVPTMGWIYFRINALHATAGAFAFLNSPIHTIMYAYYGLAAIGPHMQKYLWWKRYITQIQIAQFVLLFCHGVYFCLFQEGYHLFFSCDILFQTILYLYLFTQFYFRAYSTTKKETNHWPTLRRALCPVQFSTTARCHHCTALNFCFLVDFTSQSGNQVQDYYC